MLHIYQPLRRKNALTELISPNRNSTVRGIKSGVLSSEAGILLATTYRLFGRYYSNVAKTTRHISHKHDVELPHLPASGRPHPYPSDKGSFMARYPDIGNRECDILYLRYPRLADYTQNCHR